jgi:hypothetical protein
MLTPSLGVEATEYEQGVENFTFQPRSPIYSATRKYTLDLRIPSCSTPKTYLTTLLMNTAHTTSRLRILGLGRPRPLPPRVRILMN